MRSSRGNEEKDGVAPRRQRLSRLHLRPAIAAVLGALAGGAYAHFVGCRTGTCLITSSVWTASLYGGAVGALVGWPARRERAQARGDAEGRG